MKPYRHLKAGEPTAETDRQFINGNPIHVEPGKTYHPVTMGSIWRPVALEPVSITLLCRAFYLGYHKGHNATVDGHYTDVHHSERDTYFQDVIEEAIEEGEFPPPVAMPGWIPLSERRPTKEDADKDGYVLFWSPKYEVVQAKWDSDSSIDTHWQPHPPGPGQDGEPVPFNLTAHIRASGFRDLVPPEQYHRLDFTADMLPKGWRPFLMGETGLGEIARTDSGLSVRDEIWQSGLPVPATADQSRQRTTRPLPEAPQEKKEWFPEVGESFQWRIKDQDQGQEEDWKTTIRTGDDWLMESIIDTRGPLHELRPVPSPAAEVKPEPFDFMAHLQRQREWSERTFGPDFRTAGIIDHITKELSEIAKDPHDLTEWMDVVILALDGAWRAGHSPEDIQAALIAKQAKNEGRKWPDWRTMPEGKAIEHDRAGENPEPAAPVPPAGFRILADEEKRNQWISGAMYFSVTNQWKQLHSIRNTKDLGCNAHPQDTIAVPISAPVEGPKRSYYDVTIKGVEIDVYDILDGFGITNPAAQHAIKKGLRSGNGHKTTRQDYEESAWSFTRAAQIEAEKETAPAHANTTAL